MFWIFHSMREEELERKGKERKPGKQVVAPRKKKQLRSCKEGWVSAVVAATIASAGAGHAQKRDGHIHSKQRPAVFVDFRMFRMHKQSKSAWTME